MMKLKANTEHALRCLAYLAQCQAAGREEYVNTNEIITMIGFQRRTAFLILSKLREACMVDSSAGALGGFRLARPANQITLYDVIAVMEGGVDLPFPALADSANKKAGAFRGSVILAQIQDSLSRDFMAATIADCL